MRKVLLTALALCTMGIASAQMTDGTQARVYAYGLDQAEETGTVTTYTLTFKTNTAATEASVNLKDANGDVKYTVPAVKTDDAGKAWEAVVDVYELNKLGKDVVAGDYTWEATVSAPEVTAWTELAGTPTYSDKKSAFRFFRSFGLCVDQNPESDYFGNVYAAHQYVSTDKVSNYRTAGMYVYNPDLTLQNNGNPYANNIFGIGEASVSSSSLSDMCVSEDGRLFFTATDASIYNVYELSPNDLTNPIKVFCEANYGVDQYEKSSLVITEDAVSTRLTGIRGAITTMGYGEDTELWF